MDVSNDWALRSWLLGFGADVKVLAPRSLVETLRDELSRAGKQYVGTGVFSAESRKKGTGLGKR